MEAFLQSAFSVAVAAFLLLKVEKELRRLRQSIDTLRHCSVCRVSPWHITLDDDAGEEVEDEI